MNWLVLVHNIELPIQYISCNTDGGGGNLMYNRITVPSSIEVFRTQVWLAGLADTILDSLCL